MRQHNSGQGRQQQAAGRQLAIASGIWCVQAPNSSSSSSQRGLCSALQQCCLLCSSKVTNQPTPSSKSIGSKKPLNLSHLVVFLTTTSTSTTTCCSSYWQGSERTKDKEPRLPKACERCKKRPKLHRVSPFQDHAFSTTSDPQHTWLWSLPPPPLLSLSPPHQAYFEGTHHTTTGYL